MLNYCGQKFSGSSFNRFCGCSCTNLGLVNALYDIRAAIYNHFMLKFEQLISAIQDPIAKPFTSSRTVPHLHREIQTRHICYAENHAYFILHATEVNDYFILHR